MNQFLNVVKKKPNKYPNAVKKRLTSLIMKMSALPSLFVRNPEKDFTRERKLPFGTMLRLLLYMGGNSICKELLEEHDYDIDTPTTSAFVQQRDKILPEALEFLFHEFTCSFPDTKTYRGYRLLAIDGSDLHIATDPSDSDTYYQNREGVKGYNLLHLNAMYYLYSRLYVDAIVQPSKLQNERKALTDIVDRSHIDKAIIIGDRNYEGYNVFAHIQQKGWNYVIRVKDLDSNGILSGLHLPATDEFDVHIQRILTRKQTKEVKAHPEIYRFIPKNSTFDLLDDTNQFYTMSFRVVRFKVDDDSYQTIISNLPESAFPPAELKELYRRRWGIESSFRELKYSIGLVNFHSKKTECIIQEIFARMTMYNFSEMIVSHVVIHLNDAKYEYQVNFTVAIHICRRFLRLRNNAHPPDVEALIKQNILPIRPDRKYKRNIRSRSSVSFTYRVA